MGGYTWWVTFWLALVGRLGGRTLARLSYFAFQNFWIVAETPQKPVRNQPESVCAVLWEPPQAFGLVSCGSGVWDRFGPKSAISGRILKIVGGTFSSAEFVGVPVVGEPGVPTTENPQPATPGPVPQELTPPT